MVPVRGLEGPDHDEDDHGLEVVVEAGVVLDEQMVDEPVGGFYGFGLQIRHDLLADIEVVDGQHLHDDVIAPLRHEDVDELVAAALEQLEVVRALGLLHEPRVDLRVEELPELELPEDRDEGGELPQTDGGHYPVHELERVLVALPLPREEPHYLEAVRIVRGAPEMRIEFCGEAVAVFLAGGARRDVPLPYEVVEEPRGARVHPEGDGAPQLDQALGLDLLRLQVLAVHLSEDLEDGGVLLRGEAEGVHHLEHELEVLRVLHELRDVVGGLVVLHRLQPVRLHVVVQGLHLRIVTAILEELHEDPLVEAGVLERH